MNSILPSSLSDLKTAFRIRSFRFPRRGDFEGGGSLLLVVGVFGDAMPRYPPDRPPPRRRVFPWLSGGPLQQQGTHAQSVQAAHVIGQAHQTPFEAHFAFAPQEELAEPHRGFDDPEDGFHGLLPLFV